MQFLSLSQSQSQTVLAPRSALGRAICCATLLGVVLCPCVTSAQARSSSGGMKQVQVVDPQFNMVAFTLTIPANWSFEGAVLTGPGCDGDTSTFAYRAWSDDLSYGIQRTPQLAWYTPQDPRTPIGPKCKKMRALAAGEYGALIAPTLRPGSRVVNESEAPEAEAVARVTQNLEQAMAQSAGQMGMQRPHFSSDAKRLRLEYTMGNQPEEEFMDVMEQVGDTASPTVTSQSGQALRYQNMMTKKTLAWVITERAPQGRLDAMAGQLDAIRTSLKINPDWDNRVAQWMKDRGAQRDRQSWQMTQSTLQLGQQQHNALMNQHQADMNSIAAQGQQRKDQFDTQQAGKAENNSQFQARMNAKSAHISDVTDFVLDQQYYVNPVNGNRSTISTTYSNNWQSGSGQQVLSNIKGYDPNGDVPGNWTQLQPILH